MFVPLGTGRATSVVLTGNMEASPPAELKVALAVSDFAIPALQPLTAGAEPFFAHSKKSSTCASNCPIIRPGVSL